jgi:hypothetical protein
MKPDKRRIITMKTHRFHIVFPLHRLTVLSAYSLILFLLTFIVTGVNGQGKNEEVTIIAPYIPTIGNTAKIPFRPEVTPTEQEQPTFKFDYITKKYDTRLEVDQIEPMKYSENEDEQLYRNYAKVGIGNYATPYIDFLASSLQSEKYQIGVRLKHLSSQGKIKDYPPSAYSHNLFSMYGKIFTKTHTLSVDAGYKRDVVHFYGFSPDSFPDIEYTKDDLKQRFQHIYGNIEFSSNYREAYKLNHDLKFGVHYFTDLYGTKESQVSLFTGFDKAFKTSGSDFEHSFKLDFGLDFYGYKDSVTSFHPYFIKIDPEYKFSFDQYRFTIGLDIEMAGKNTTEGSSFGFDVFPLLKAEVIVLEDQVKAFAEISGHRTINSFRSLTDANPFIISTPEITNTDEQISIGGGITGNFSGLNFTADAYYSYINDMPLFINDTVIDLQNRFDVIYDNMNVLKIRASLDYVKIKDLDARLHAAYYHYIPKNELKAWQMPNFELGLDLGYTLKQKYMLRASILALGPRYARTYQGEEIVAKKLGTAFDLGAGFEYRINRMISAYVDVNNILNQHYQRWNNYPVQGILAMLGVKISF